MAPAARDVTLHFDFVDAAGQPAPLTFSRPSEIITADVAIDVAPAMRAVEAAVRRGGYAAGFVSYEAAPGFDAALTTREPRAGLPLAWFGVFEQPDPTSARPWSELERDETATDARWTPDITDAAYRAGIDAVRDAILNGDSYQSNYTFRLHGRVDPRTAAARYRRLAADQRAPYAAFLDIGAWQILSLSPELFLRIDGRRLVTRPMKGTAARGSWADDDRARGLALQASPKNRAENVMIVDLARNDVGRVADVGSVRTDGLFALERYPSVWQMASTVEGRLRAGVGLTEIFAALFPAGSITGAPKTSSMRLISRIEAAPRGVYCGAIGVCLPNGDAVFNVAIRTALIETATGRATYGVGGGITWDSTAADEYAEALSKAAALTPAPTFDLFETMRLDAGVYVRVEGHLARLSESAAYFDRPCDRAAIDRALTAHAAAHPTGTRRVRLRLRASGDVELESWPFDRVSSATQTVALARAPISSSDRFLHHKTTRRDIYDRHRAAQPDAFDVLLWNERGEVTEFTIGNLVAEIDGARWTPPQSSGLLAGVFRRALLDAGDIRERVLTRDDLTRASRLWLVNSLREWVGVRIG